MPVVARRHIRLFVLRSARKVRPFRMMLAHAHENTVRPMQGIFQRMATARCYGQAPSMVACLNQMERREYVEATPHGLSLSKRRRAGSFSFSLDAYLPQYRMPRQPHRSNTPSPIPARQIVVRSAVKCCCNSG